MSTQRNDTKANKDKPELSERERDILRFVVRNFIDTAGPVGSRTLAKRFDIGLSPASIRNTMSDLEEMGYLGHPYTSAGRVPTEQGYRRFVDELMEPASLSPQDQEVLRKKISEQIGDLEDLFRESSRLLGHLSNLLGVVLSPRLSTSLLERIDIVRLSTSRLMFVLSVGGGLVKTIVLECEANVRKSDLDEVVTILNERLAGLTLEEIRDTYDERLADLDDEPTGIVQLTLDESSVLFSEPNEGRMQYGGAQNILTQPEFQEVSDFRQLMGLLEDEDGVVQLLESGADEDDKEDLQARITIGSEHSSEEAESYSIVTSHYSLGGAKGTLGIIGPTRMDYPRVAALVENMAQLITRNDAKS